MEFIKENLFVLVMIVFLITFLYLLATKKENFKTNKKHMFEMPYKHKEKQRQKHREALRHCKHRQSRICDKHGCRCKNN